MQWGGVWNSGYVCKTIYTLTCSGVDCIFVGTCARQFTRSHVVGCIVVSWVCVQDNLHTHKQSGGLLYRGYVCKTIYSHAVGKIVVSWVCVRDNTLTWTGYVCKTIYTLTCSGVDCGIVGTCARQHTHM